MPASCRSGTSRSRSSSPAELEQSLRERPPREFLAAMFGNEPARWSDSLAGDERLRFTLNTLTRIRFVAADGTLEFQTKDGADAAPPGFRPWFDVPGRRTAGVPIAFGHWSSLGLVDRPDLLGLDTGCVWGGRLTAVRIDGGGASSSRSTATPPPARSNEAAPAPLVDPVERGLRGRQESCEDPAPRGDQAAPGDVAEWSKAAVLKTAEGATPP